MAKEKNEKENAKEIPEEMRKLFNRLNKISGQITGIKKMLEGDSYPTEILLQVSSCHAALDSFVKEFLAENLVKCAIDGVKTNNKMIIDELARSLLRIAK